MAHEHPLICRSADLIEGGTGVRFDVDIGGKSRPGFAVRYNGRAHAYLNTCPHMGTELDWQPGEFFDVSGLYLICATHGAVFIPETGLCSAGPCKGMRLIRMPIVENDGSIFLSEGFNLHVQ
jgi:nitrite reductase/ring-hydroxylating ferredoxin subunit